MATFSNIISEELYNENFIIRPLMEDDAPLDFDAMLDRLEVQEWVESGNTFTEAENLSNITRHATAHRNRTALTFTIQTPGETRALGCVYIDRVGDVFFVDEARSVDEDSVILRFWVRDSEIDRDLDVEVFETVELWLRTWQLDKTVYFVVDDSDMRQSFIAERYKLKLETSVISKNSVVKHLYRFLPR